MTQNPISRRQIVLGSLMACAGAAALDMRISRAQGGHAPVGDGTPLADLGMELTAEQTRGMHDAEVTKIMGDNFPRLFKSNL